MDSAGREQSPSRKQKPTKNTSPPPTTITTNDEVFNLKQQAVALKAAGDTKGAKELLEKARELEFRHVRVEDLDDPLRLKQYAISKKRTGDLEAARQALQKATQIQIQQDQAITNALEDNNNIQQDSDAKKKAKAKAVALAVPSQPGAYAASAAMEPTAVATSRSPITTTTQERKDTASKKRAKAGLKQEEVVRSQPGAYAATASSRSPSPKKTRKKRAPPSSTTTNDATATAAGEPDHVASSGQPHHPTSSLDDSTRDAVVVSEAATIKKRAKAGLRGNTKPGVYAATETSQHQQSAAGKRGRISPKRAQVAAASTTDPIAPNSNVIVQRNREDDGDQKPGAQPGIGGVGKSKNRKKSPNKKKKTKTANYDLEAQRTTSNIDGAAEQDERTEVWGDELDTSSKRAYNNSNHQDLEVRSSPVPPTEQENLIVAELVQEQTEQTTNILVSAVKVDPNADDDNNKPIYQHKQFPKIAAAVCILLMIIIISVAVVASGGGGNKKPPKQQPDGGPTELPTVAPTAVNPNYAIIEEKVKLWLQDPNQLQNQESPYYKALRWIVYDDQIDPNAKNLQQRYLLAAFHFATSQKTPWSECGYQPDQPLGDCEYMIERKGGVLETVIEPRWLTRGIDECNWAGVKCYSSGNNNEDDDDEPTIKDIVLNRFRMNGNILPELSRFTRLKELNLSYNRGLRGSIPTLLGQLSELEKFKLHECTFTGTLPEQMCNALSLEELDLSENNLVGTIPTCLGNLIGLEELILDKNDMTGTIPTELGRLVNLTEAEFHANELNGSMPSEICALQGLTKLKVNCDVGDEDFVACDPPCNCICG